MKDSLYWINRMNAEQELHAFRDAIYEWERILFKRKPVLPPGSRSLWSRQTEILRRHVRMIDDLRKTLR